MIVLSPKNIKKDNNSLWPHLPMDVIVHMAGFLGAVTGATKQELMECAKFIISNALAIRAQFKEKVEIGILQQRILYAGTIKYRFEIYFKNVGQLLIHLVWGEEEQAEALLKQEASLASMKGNIKDTAKPARQFNNISGFQYAI